MRIGQIAVLFAAAVLVSGCVQIPQAAVDVNRDVSKGISALRDNGNEMVDAWEEMGYRMLDERWARVYSKADADFRAKRKLAPGSALSADQQQNVAGLATLYRDEVRKKIQAKAAELRAVINKNAKMTLDANESITSLLISANAVTSVQQTALKSVGELVPVLPKVSSFVEELLKEVG
jgi:hypothetical protein